MQSIAQFTYPQIVWKNGEKLLWNPIHRKALKNRPEERVRLRLIESLIQAGWSKHRISTEESIGTLGSSAMRTDIICYNQQFKPVILIECKAEHIPISSGTAEQVARYNQKVGAPFLMMTNGVFDFWYQFEDDKVKSLKEIPSILSDSINQNYLFDAWCKRGFAGSKAAPLLRKWVEQFLPKIWHGADHKSIQYLKFNQELTDLNLNHYYHIKSFSKTRKIALTTVDTPFGGTRLIAILNKDQENKAVLEVNLDLLFDAQNGNTSLYSKSGALTFDLRNCHDFKTIKNTAALLEIIDTLFAQKTVKETS